MTDIATEQSWRADAVHEHGWLTESSHQTSEGRVLYVRCAGCGMRRVALQPHPLLPPRFAEPRLRVIEERHPPVHHGAGTPRIRVPLQPQYELPA